MTARNAIGMMSLIATAACGTVTNVEAQSAPIAQTQVGNQRVVNETCLLQGNTQITYNTNGRGYFSMSGKAECGSKNTGTGTYRTTLEMNVESTPFGAPENRLGTNNCVQFTDISYEDPQGISNNRAAYVEMTIRPCSEIRPSIPRTNLTAYTVSPAFGPNLSNTDLDQVDKNSIRGVASYGVGAFKFIGIVQNLIIDSNLRNAGFTPQRVANDLKGMSSNGLLITSERIYRKACQTQDSDSCIREPIMATPYDNRRPLFR